MNPPFLRVVERHRTPAGDEVIEWDLRIATPNSARVPIDVLHTLEHFLDAGLKARNPLVTSTRPHGSHTGLTITAINVSKYAVMAELVADVLAAVTAATRVPRADAVQCGAAQLHNLTGARAVARELLAARHTWSEPLECAAPA